MIYHTWGNHVNHYATDVVQYDMKIADFFFFLGINITKASTLTPQERNNWNVGKRERPKKQYDTLYYLNK